MIIRYPTRTESVFHFPNTTVSRFTLKSSSRLQNSLRFSISLKIEHCTVHCRWRLRMEISSNENSQHEMLSTNDTDDHHDNVVPDISNHGGAEPKPEITEEEARGILEVIASTGKYWHNWDKLKSVLSFQLKQVLSEYPEAKMASEQQSASLGETYQELVTRLDEALLCFDEGPPFTLQRLCEVLLAARTIYPILSKLALALEKNLLVTSTLPICIDPYPQTATQKLDEADKDKSSEETQPQSNAEQNGVEPMLGDKDEIITEAEEGNIDDDMAIDMESLDEIVGSSEANSTPTENS